MGQRVRVTLRDPGRPWDVRKPLDSRPTWRSFAPWEVPRQLPEKTEKSLVVVDTLHPKVHQNTEESNVSGTKTTENGTWDYRDPPK